MLQACSFLRDAGFEEAVFHWGRECGGNWISRKDNLEIVRKRWIDQKVGSRVPGGAGWKEFLFGSFREALD